MISPPNKEFWQLEPGTDISHSGNKTSIAFNVARVSWPKIVTAVIESVKVTVVSVAQDPELAAEGHAIVNDLRRLRSEIETDSPIPLLIDDGGDDIDEYNAELETLRPASWHNSPWMYTDCYFFRRLRVCFARQKSKFWREHDVWAEQKFSSMKSSSKAILELVEWFLVLRSKLFNPGHDTATLPADRKAALEDLLQISLWGNTADLLSLLATSSEELQSRQGAEARKQLKNNVLVDDTVQVVDTMERLREETNRERVIHVVLDNAGFELISDLIFVVYLLCANYADRVVLHGKQFPWYVSDVTRNDFDTTLSNLNSPEETFTGSDKSNMSTSLPAFSSLIKSLLSSNPPKLIFNAEPFWTTAHPFARFPTFAGDLYNSLRNADLVIFKGDLNYRKLIAGGRWPADMSFEDAIGPLRGMGMRILVLRTCKGDTCVGLRKGQVEEIDPSGDGEWTRNGKYGAISFFDGKQRNEV